MSYPPLPVTLPRDPVEINQASAEYLAKCRIKQMLADPNAKLDFIKRMALKASLEDDGPVDQIADMLWGMGLRMTVDKNNPDHKTWIETGVVFLEKDASCAPPTKS